MPIQKEDIQILNELLSDIIVEQDIDYHIDISHRLHLEDFLDGNGEKIHKQIEPISSSNRQYEI